MGKRLNLQLTPPPDLLSVPALWARAATVQSTNSTPFQRKPIGIARGNPSGPRYANLAGILDCLSSCGNGSLSSRAISCGCTIASIRSLLHRMYPESEYKRNCQARIRGLAQASAKALDFFPWL